MKKTYLILILIVALINVSLASNSDDLKTTLTGKIIDKKTGESIVGATIYIPEIKTGALSDVNGVYKISNLPKAKVLVQVNFIGYKTIMQTVDLTANSKIDFAMEEADEVINEIVVTGSSKATEVKKNPVPIASIDNKALMQSINTNIIDALSKMPGLNAVTTGPNVSKPFIHGLGYNRVLTLYDGVRQEGQQWGDEHGIEVDENAVDKIEVVKGPASLIYGSDALAGVVNLIPALPVNEGQIKGSVLADYQTNNGLYEGSASLAGNNHGFIWDARLSHKQATNYQNKLDGRVFGTAFDESDASALIGINREWGFTHLNFSVYDDLQEIPDGSRDSATGQFTKQITEADLSRPIVSNSELNSYAIEPLHQHIQHYKVYSTSDFFIGQSKIALTLGWQENIRREFSHPQAPDIAGLYLVLNTFTYDVKYSLPDWNGWETTVGLNGMYQKNKNEGTEFIIPDYNEFDIGPFLFIKKSYDNLDISAGVRYDTRFFKNDAMYVGTNPVTQLDMQVSVPDTAGAKKTFSNFTHTFSGVSGSFGASYKINNNIIIKANIARGFRAPNISELSANGVHPGTAIYQLGNDNFQPEFSLQEDLGIHITSSHINFDIDVFNNNITNYIFNQKVLNHAGQDSVIVAGNETFKFQQSNAQLYGGEATLDIKLHPWDWIHFVNSVSVVYALNKGSNDIKVSDSSKYLPFIPPVHTSTDLVLNFPKKFTHFSSIYVKAGMEHYATQNRVYLTDNTETVTPGYTLFSAGVGTNITNKKGKVLFNINILGSNITDVAYQSHLSRLKYMDFYVNAAGNVVNNTAPGSGIYNMGRNISFKIIVPIN